MQFPLKAVIGGVAATVFLWLFGFPPWAALLFGTMAFLGMGGVQYIRLVARTLPMDLWYFNILSYNMLYTVMHTSDTDSYHESSD